MLPFYFLYIFLCIFNTFEIIVLTKKFCNIFNRLYFYIAYIFHVSFIFVNITMEYIPFLIISLKAHNHLLVKF